MSGNPTERMGQVSPKLVQEIDSNGDGVIDIRREFTPLVVTRLGGTLPFETESVQVECGETVTDNSGDMNIRLVMEAVCTHSEFKTLNKMRQYPDSIKLVSRAYTKSATFDELKWDRVPDSNGSIDADGGQSTEPHYEIQLQSKEEGQE